mmetsp:Transcript_40214/g.134119  ORF Transcript_40214/g.134119 Transcript_40214/m.134119 type:complete len:258 (-) Transcript_40214:4-777(-)
MTPPSESSRTSGAMNMTRPTSNAQPASTPSSIKLVSFSQKTRKSDVTHTSDMTRVFHERHRRFSSGIGGPSVAPVLPPVLAVVAQSGSPELVDQVDRDEPDGEDHAVAVEVLPGRDARGVHAERADAVDDEERGDQLVVGRLVGRPEAQHVQPADRHGRRTQHRAPLREEAVRRICSLVQHVAAEQAAALALAVGLRADLPRRRPDQGAGLHRGHVHRLKEPDAQVGEAEVLRVVDMRERVRHRELSSRRERSSTRG